jgi:hypothetical protein
MIFTRRFLGLFLAGGVATLLFWSWPRVGPVVLLYDLLLLIAALWDYRHSGDQATVEIQRRLPRRLMIGIENEIEIVVANRLKRNLNITLKDEFPPELTMSGKRMMRLQLAAQGQARASYALVASAARRLSLW